MKKLGCEKYFFMTLLAAVLLLGTAGAEENGLPKEESGELPVLVEYDPFGGVFQDGISLQSVEIIPFYGTTYGEGLREAYPDAYKIYQAIDSFMSKPIAERKTEWMPYLDENKTIRYMLGYEIGFDNAGITDRDDAIYTALAAYDNDHPFETCILGREFLPGNNYVGLSVFDIVNGLGTDYNLDAESVDQDIAARLDLLKKAIEVFADQYQRDSMDSDLVTDDDRYQYIHDYLCRNLYYNHPAAAENASSTPENMNAHNAFGALVGLGIEDGSLVGSGDVVCQGYADAFLLLCQRVDLPCAVVIGAGTGSGLKSDHMWNAVRLEDNWYCLDVTWDDIDETKQTTESTVKYSTNRYDYFLNNDYFVGSNKDHNILGQSNYGGNSLIEAPLIKSGRYGTENCIPSEITLWLSPAEGQTTSKLSDALYVVTQTGTSSFWYDSIPVADIILRGNTTVSSTCYIPADREYWIESGSDSGSEQYQLIQADDFTGAMFYVANDGCLALRDVTLDGHGQAASAPLVQTASATEEQESTVLLNHSSITGNRGACGISADGAVLLTGNCQIRENRNAESQPENLTLRENGYIVVLNDLKGSQIGVTASRNSYFAWPNKTYGWTDSDRAVFTPDDSSLLFTYDPEENAMFCSSVVTGDKTQDIYITYASVPSLETIPSQPITLTNTTASTKSVVLYAAMYDASGKMLQICEVSTPVLEAGATSEQIVLPEAAEGTVVYSLLVLDHGGMSCIPLSQCIRYDFTSSGATT